MAIGQSSGYENILAEIESNNRTLQAYADYMEASSLADRDINAIEPLNVEAQYLPFGNNDSPQFVEVQVSQQFDFPSVYRTRSDYIEQQQVARKAAFELERQEILANAINLFTKLVYVQKREAVESQRLDRARQLYDNIQEMYDQEQIGKLELNKARVTWLQEQFTLDALAAERSQLLEALRGLNGGVPITYSEDLFADYEGLLAIASRDSLWSEKLSKDPDFLLRKEREKTAQKHISVTKKERLPQFGVGMNYQGFRGDNYAGFTGGISLPVWRNKSKMQAAEAAYTFEMTETSARVISGEAQFKALYEQYVALLARYMDYKTTLATLDSEELLQQAFELGHFSYLEYYMERTFYRDAYDELLRMEADLYTLKNQLLKHQL